MAGALGGGAADPRMNTRRVGVAAVCIWAAGCGGARIPAALRGYDILVEQAADSQATELARAMRAYGFRVRRVVRGGGRPTAALISFTFQETGVGTVPGLYVRLADTRTGAIVGAAMVPLDSTVPTPRARADAAVRALVAAPRATPP